MLKMKIEVAEQLRKSISQAAQKDVSAIYIAHYAKDVSEENVTKPGHEAWELYVYYDIAPDGDWYYCLISIDLDKEDISKSTVKGRFVCPKYDGDGNLYSWI